MTLIGRRCKDGDVLSRAELIARTLSGPQGRQSQEKAGPRTEGVRRLAAEVRTAEVFPGPVSGALFHATRAAPPGDGSGPRGKDTQAATAAGIHLYPSRTEKLNLRAPMVLRKRESRSPPPSRPGQTVRAFFCPPETPAPARQIVLGEDVAVPSAVC